MPNSSFEQFYYNENNVNSVPGIIPFWSSTGGIDWFQVNNINPQTGNNCNSQYCATVPRNFSGWQQPHMGLGYTGFYSYMRSIPDTYREMPFIKLSDTLEIGKAYCVSFYVSLADTSTLSNSLLSACFITDTMYIYNLFPTYASTWHSMFTPQVTNSTGFLSSKTNWMKVEGSFVADSAYQFLMVGEFSNVTVHDTLRVPGGHVSYPNPYAYYYLDDISVTELNEPCYAAGTDTIFANETQVIQLGANTNVNAAYLWSPDLGLSDLNEPNPYLYVTQSAWYYVQKTQCGYVTYDSVYVQANPIGIKEESVFGNEYSIVPNPNNGSFSLQNKSGKFISGNLIITDALGKTIAEQSMIREEKIRVELSTKNLKPGVYFVKLVSESNQLLYVGEAIVQ